ncbi:MAG: helix-turn-helix transcriptional regulator [Lachnospiraceae bacterium]|jgi:Response regulator containing CheY-like receiver domain and AraC-type DNA-binding domain
MQNTLSKKDLSEQELSQKTVLSFVQNLLKNNRIPVQFVSPSCENFAQMDYGLRTAILHDYKPDAIHAFLGTLKDKTICHLKDIFQCSYSILRLPDSDMLMVCGPVLFEEMRSSHLNEIITRLQLPPDLSTVLQGYYLRLASFPAPALYYSLFLTLGNFLFGENEYETIYQDLNDMDNWYESYSHQYQSAGNSMMNIEMIEMRYALEAQMLEAVFLGNEAKSMALVSKLSSLTLPHRMPDELRDCKDYTIAFNTLFRKKAEEAGVHPIHIDLCSNQHVQLIEQATSKEQCYAVWSRIVLNYCRLIRKHTLKDYSLLTQKIITYINSDLTADLSLKAMSDWLNVNASYLSTLFKKEVGIPLTDFVNRQRIEQAKKLLIVTELPMKLIAQQCGIPDIYYFSRLFKKRTGVTPKLYREHATREHDPYHNKDVNTY